VSFHGYSAASVVRPWGHDAPSFGAARRSSYKTRQQRRRSRT